ncbi:MAG: nucleotide exchange factor GrpE [Deltaproteobacteria bacterium]|nr:nucleotide exchange factor GrpE [Deltaproteobacteria bacterium]
MRPKSVETPAGAAADAGSAEPAAADEAAAGERERLELRAEIAEIKDRWMRAQADLENFKRRATREKQDALRFGSEQLLKDLLPVIDNLHRALAHAGSDDPIAAGVELVLRGFDEVFERHGVKVVSARGTPFDPSFHEAISHVESEHPPNTVIDEHQRGYILHDRLLRPALVTVGKGPARDENVAKNAEDA